MENPYAFWHFLMNNLGTITISGVLGYLYRPGVDGFWKRHWKKINNHDEERRQLHTKIVGIVSEGKAHHFQKKPRSEEHIESTINELGQIDRHAADLLRRFHTCWFIAEDAYTKCLKVPDYLDQYHEMEMGASGNGNMLLEQIKHWR